jgi:protein-tyrosine phosphatase
MLPQVYWISTPTTGRLATMARPRGGEWLEDELLALRSLGADTLVNLLTDAELEELDLGAESRLAVAAGMNITRFPIVDYSVPSLGPEIVEFVAQCAQAIQAGRMLVIHCRQGIGRSSLIAATVLAQFGVAPPEAFTRIAVARGRPVPDTDEQRAWVSRFLAFQLWEAEG